MVDLKNVCWVFFKGSDLYQLNVLDQIFININTKYRYKRTQAAETLFNNFWYFETSLPLLYCIKYLVAILPRVSSAICRDSSFLQLRHATVTTMMMNSTMPLPPATSNWIPKLLSESLSETFSTRDKNLN